jgi:peptidoglycan/xylan/chitin deacetylase (PgdA/CDA1 family)
MPHWTEQADTLERWGRFPGRERADGAEGVVLTFDDGPDEDSTPAVLDALDEAGGRATFFLVGEQVEAAPGLAREIVARRHDVQLHGYGHAAHDALTPEEALRDLERGAGALVDATGVEPRFYRPPYGRFSSGSYEACRVLGLEPVYWSAWGTDWETIAPQRIAELVIPDLAPGAVVLLHDSPRYSHRPSAQPTVDALPLIAARAAELGLPFLTLAEALDGVTRRSRVPRR